MNKSAVKRWGKYLLFAACFGLFGWMVWKSGPSQLWETLCSVPEAIGLSIIIWGIGYLLNAASFREVLKGQLHSDVGVQLENQNRVPAYLEVLRVTISGYAINYITPFGLLGGEPYRVLVLKQQLGPEKATQGVVLYSMMHIASHFCFWLLAAFVAISSASALHPKEGDSQELWGVIVLMVACMLLLLLFWRLYRRGIALRIMRRWVDWPLLNPSLLPPTHFVRALGLELFSRLVNVIEYWVIMQALGYTEFGYTEAFLVVAFSSLLANLLFFSPLQMGSREGGIYLALRYLLVGVNLPVAVTLSFATRIREFVWIAVGLLLVSRK